MDQQVLRVEREPVEIISRKILNEVMLYRRTPRSNPGCHKTECQNCMEPHLGKIIQSVRKNEPISFVLPAFPGKSPNLNKVLAPTPDRAEELALHFLSSLCKRIQAIYKPGAKIIICSDGRVFSDIVGMKESDVTVYQQELSQIIEKAEYKELSTFNLDDRFGDLSFNQMRDELLKRYSQSLDFLKYKVKRGAQPSASHEEHEANRMYKGITRFMLEDSLCPGQTQSKTALQKEAKRKAYEVIRRSNAWSDLIADIFPDSVRLSIHPQGCGSQKLGLRLIGNESWMTPWHGVAVLTPQGPVLLKKAEAEEMGAVLIRNKEGRPSHYHLTRVGVLYGH